MYTKIMWLILDSNLTGCPFAWQPYHLSLPQGNIKGNIFTPIRESWQGGGRARVTNQPLQAQKALAVPAPSLLAVAASRHGRLPLKTAELPGSSSSLGLSPCFLC